ncbi:MAG: RNA polymerase sigma factor [Ardenticatenales bacterium]|nr:RNA polymerase sigma factor [Ardenticatenales bacterium]
MSGRFVAPIASPIASPIDGPSTAGQCPVDADAARPGALDGDVERERVARERIDRELLVRVAQGDADAHRQVYERHGPAVLAFLISRTADRALSEDLLHDVMLAAWRAAGTFRGASAVRTWLLSIAHNKACNALRRLKRERLGAWIGSAAVAASGARSFMHAAAEPHGIEPDARVELAAAVAALPEDQRTALVLYFYHGLSVDEIAQVVGAPGGTVKSRMSRGKASLRARLGERQLGERRDGKRQTDAPGSVEGEVGDVGEVR